MPHSMGPGEVLAGRYRLDDLISESRGGRFWRAHDRVLARHVAVHVIAVGDPRSAALMAAARRSATLSDARLLRVLDVDERDGFSYVVNEWGSGSSLDIMLNDGPLSPRRAAWLVAEVGETLTAAHAAGIHHGRLVPENVMIDRTGSVKVIGFAVDAALHGDTDIGEAADVHNLAALLYAALVGRWPGTSPSAVPIAPRDHGRILRPRKVRAGVPRALDAICEISLNPDETVGNRQGEVLDSAQAITAALGVFVGNLAVAAATEAAQQTRAASDATQVLPRVGDIEETQNGRPVVEEGPDPVSETGWLRARDDHPPPPPPFEEPTARPLFAPDPPPGQPPRRPRAAMTADRDTSGAGTGAGTGGGTTDDDGGYWPWAQDPAGAGTRSSSPGGRTSGPRRSGRGSAVGFDDGSTSRPAGRTWLRLAALLALAAVLLVAVVFASTIGGGPGDDPSGAPTPDDPTPSSPPAPPRPVPIAAVTDFDPQADPPEENPDQAPDAADDDPGTAWSTSTYEQNLGPGGLKQGVGLLLDLGKVRDVANVTVMLRGSPTELSLLAGDSESAPTVLADVEEVAVGDGTGQRVSLSPEKAVAARFLVVWLTSLPDVGGFRGEIAEVVVRS